MSVLTSSDDLNRLRATRHASLWHLEVYHPAAIWTAQVDGNQTKGSTTINVENVDQVRSPFLHYRVLFGSEAGLGNKGNARWKSYSSGVLTVGAHNAKLHDGDYITVLEEIKPEGVTPRITGESGQNVYEDGTKDYSDQNTKRHPLARFGPPRRAVIDPLTGLATLQFYSVSQGQGGANLTDEDFNFPGGTVVSGNGTSGDPYIVTWDTPGEYWVRLRVEDEFGKVHRGWRPVFIREFDSPRFTAIEVEGLEGDVDAGGWGCKITAWGDSDIDQFPDQAMVCIFAEDYYDEDRISIGGAFNGAEDVVFVGWIRRNTTRQNWARGAVEFVADGIGKILYNIQGPACTFHKVSSPANWHEFATLNSNIAAFHILTEHTTVDHLLDVRLSADTLYREFVSMTKASIGEQLSRQVMAPARSRIGTSRQGILYARENPQLFEANERPDNPTLETTLNDIVGEIELGPELHEQAVSLVDFSGFTYAEDDDGNPIEATVYSLAPKTPWTFGKVERVDSIRVADQTDANKIAGHWEAWRNNQYADVGINWRGNYRIFDVYPSVPLDVNLAEDQNVRGLTWENLRFWPTRVRLDYKPGVVTCSTVQEKDSLGDPGITGNYPPKPPEPPKTGCCYLPNGSKTMMSQADCEAQGGTYQGDGVPCGSDGGSQNDIGCCTFPDNSKEITTRGACESAGGTFAGSNTSCPPTYPGGPNAGDWRPKILLLTTKGPYLSTNFTGPAGTMPTWTRIGTGLPSGITNWLVLEPDPYRPSNRQYLIIFNDVTDPTHPRWELYSGDLSSWTLLTDSRVSEDIAQLLYLDWGAAQPGDSDASALTFVSVGADINRDGKVYLWAAGTQASLYFGSHFDSRVILFYSDAYGTPGSWHIMNPPSPFLGPGDMTVGPNAGIHYGEVGDFGGAGRLYAPVFSAGVFGFPALFRSDDFGLTWESAGMGPGTGFDEFESVGFCTDVYKDIVYMWRFGSSTTDANSKVWRSIDSGDNFSVIHNGSDRAIDGSSQTIGIYRYKVRPVIGPPGGAQTLYVVTFGNNLRKTEDGGSTWVTHSTSGLPAGMGLGISLIHDAPDKLYGLNLSGGASGAGNHAIYVSEDNGETWVGKAGSDRSSGTTTGIPDDCAVTAILEMWDS